MDCDCFSLALAFIPPRLAVDSGRWLWSRMLFDRWVVNTGDGAGF